MQRAYRSLLHLYPTAYRHEFGEEMICVFNQARNHVRRQQLSAGAAFCARELMGLLCGAVREHLRQVLGSNDSCVFRRFDMRPEFRFPRSAISLMVIILAGVLLAIQKAQTVQLKYAAGSVSMWSTLGQFLLLAFLLVAAVAVAGWAILFALKRSGVHRLNDVQTWPEQK